MALVKFKPLGERLVIQPTEQEQTTASGIILPDTVKEKPQEDVLATVLVPVKGAQKQVMEKIDETIG